MYHQSHQSFRHESANQMFRQSWIIHILQGESTYKCLTCSCLCILSSQKNTHTHITLNMLNLFWLRVTLWPAEGKHVIERVRRCHGNRREILSVCQNLKEVDPGFAFLWNLWDLKVTWLSSKRLQEHQQYDLNLHTGSKAPRGRGLRYRLTNNSVLV